MTPLFESFVFGAANSVHCACMCGPLAFAAHGGIEGTAAYHFGRSLSYGTLGVVLGGLGAAFGAREIGVPTAWVAFVLAAGLVWLTVVGERGAVKIPGLGRVLQSALTRTRRLRPSLRAGLLGLATPLLPCGLLWAACAGASVAGSGIAGGEVMLGFALGSLPLLALAQSQAGRVLRHFGPRTLAIAQRIAMLSAAALLVYRGWSSMHGGCCCH